MAPASLLLLVMGEALVLLPELALAGIGVIPAPQKAIALVAIRVKGLMLGLDEADDPREKLCGPVMPILHK
jgi:hypothetical protein